MLIGLSQMADVLGVGFCASQMTEAVGDCIGNKDELELAGRLSRNIFRDIGEETLGRESPARVLTLILGELGADSIGECGAEGGFEGEGFVEVGCVWTPLVSRVRARGR